MHQQTQKIPPLEIGLLLLLGILWGMPYALTKIALPTIPPITQVTARVILAAAVLWFVVLITGRTLPKQPGIAARLFVQGILGCAIPYTLIAFGQQSVDSSLASILNSTAPLLLCLIGLASPRQAPLTTGQLIGVALGLGGVVMIAGAGAFAGLGKGAVGQSAILLATLSSAIGALHARRFVNIAPEVVAAGTLTSAGLVLTPLCFLVEAPLDISPSVAALAALAANAVVATALGFVVYFRLIRTVGSVGTTTVGYLRPAIGVLIGCSLIGESMTWPIGCGLVAILVSVAAVNGTTVPQLREAIVAGFRRPPSRSPIIAGST